MVTTHRITSLDFVLWASERFRRNGQWKLMRAVLKVPDTVTCCGLSVWRSSTREDSVFVYCHTGRYQPQVLNVGDSYSNGVCRITFDGIRRGHADITVRTIKKAERVAR